MSASSATHESTDAISPPRAPTLRLDGLTDGAGRLVVAGEWTLERLAGPPPGRPDPGAGPGRLQLSGHASALDSAGALALARAIDSLEQAGWSIDMAGLPEAQRKLVGLLKQRLPELGTPKARGEPMLARLGRATVDKLVEANAFLAFIGELVSRGGRLLALPWRIRWREVVAEVEAAGLRALGIVGLLSFLVGMVMAYQAGATLQDYGANVLIVDLVGIITLREMGPLLTAIIVAGRTGSSYTAQLGTMRITEEIDALRAIGIPPFDMLILPKVIALIVVVPLLTVFANVMGLLGGAVVAAYRFDVSFAVYFDRLPDAVSLTTLLLGLVKTPVFAIVIALIGCMQGMRVAGSALAVGRATTVSVVQATFLVIVLDALFSVLFNLMGY